MARTGKQHDFIRWFAQLGMADVPLVGGKNAYLARCTVNWSLAACSSNWFRGHSGAYRNFLRTAENSRSWAAADLVISDPLVRCMLT